MNYFNEDKFTIVEEIIIKENNEKIIKVNSIIIRNIKEENYQEKEDLLNVFLYKMQIMKNNQQLKL